MLEIACVAGFIHFTWPIEENEYRDVYLDPTSITQVDINDTVMMTNRQFLGNKYTISFDRIDQSFTKVPGGNSRDEAQKIISSVLTKCDN